MAKYVKLPIEIEATQWFKMGDHPKVWKTFYFNMEPEYRVETLEGDARVYPGDWIITGIKGEHYPCKDEIFRATYKEVVVNTEDYKQRIISEKKELDIKINKLCSFVGESPRFETIGAIKQAHIESQLCAMQDYSCILERRIKR